MAIDLLDVDPLVLFDDIGGAYAAADKSIMASPASTSVYGRKNRGSLGTAADAMLIAGRTPGLYLPSTYAKPAVRHTVTPMSMGQPAGLDAVINGTSSWSVFTFYKQNNTDPTDNHFILTKGAGGIGNRVAIGRYPPTDVDGSIPDNVKGWGNYQTAQTRTVLTGTTQPHSYAYVTCPPGQSGQGIVGVGCQRIFLAGAATAATAGPNTITADTTTNYVLCGWPDPFSDASAAAVDMLVFMIVPTSLLGYIITELSDRCYDYFGVANPRKSVKNFAWFGNSIYDTSSITSQLTPIPEAVRINLDMPLGSLHNYSIGTQKTSDHISEGPDVYDPLLDVLGKDTALVFSEGSNDQSEPHIRTFCEDRIAAGWNKDSIVVATVLSRDQPVDFNANVDAENAAIRAAQGDYYALLADPASDPDIGGNNASPDRDYFYDGVHLTRIGSDKNAPYFTAPVARALATSSSSDNTTSEGGPGLAFTRQGGYWFGPKCN